MRIQSFIGHAQTSIDAKGRTSFPREFRRLLVDEDGAEVVVSPGPNRSLILFTVKEWNAYMDEISRRPRTKQNQEFANQLLAFAHCTKLDGQNRISLNSTLLKHAMLDGEVLFTARQGKTLGLWNPQRWNELYGLSTDDALATFDEGFWVEEPGRDDI
ncbi:MAG: MraZ family transcriptional regulator [Fibrobacter sp.]|nr:MraZ family transcriptional regulator [Fibrobacter sp.]